MLIRSGCFFVVALGLCACGTEPGPLFEPVDEAELPIINGTACETGELDTAVAILVDADIQFGFGGSQTVKTVVCTGTLIAPDVVLAAAHCLDASALTLGFGTVDREEYSITLESDLTELAGQSQMTPVFPDDAIKATQTVVHENFSLEAFQSVNGPGNFYDIGLLFLASSVTKVEPELVITAEEAAQMDVGDAVEIAGWGQQTQTSGPFDAPPPGTVGAKICATSFINEIGTHEMQIGGDETTSRKCHGDSGGPTYLAVETPHARSRRVIGITSHAYDESDCAKGGVDTRVDVWLDWIDGQMRGACADGTRVWCEEEGIIPPAFFDPVETPGSDGGPTEKDDEQAAQDCQCDSTAGDDPMALGLLAFLLLLQMRRRR